MGERALKKVAIIGSTGSIGEQALDVVRRHPDKLKVVALAAGSNWSLLLEQAREFQPQQIAVGDERAYRQMKCRYDGEIGLGMEEICRLACHEEADLVLIAVSGSAGILPTYSAVDKGKTVALANKESLVAAGEVIMAASRRSGALIIPVDSEHSAIFQCLKGEDSYVERLWLTASGGPFRQCTQEELAAVTPDMALRHPNWRMGAKITVDSATLMNKGLEVLEARHLFALDLQKIKVVIHPESIVHSLVEFRDGSFLAHLGATDMRIPIQYAFSFPERWISPAKTLDLVHLGGLHFYPPDEERFPALSLAYEVGRRGGTLPCVMSAANEVAVAMFLAGKIPFTGIIEVVEEVLARHQNKINPGMDEILAADFWAKEEARAVGLKISREL